MKNTTVDLAALTSLSTKAAHLAGEAILGVYHSADFGVESKDDKSPLTLADRLGHNTIVEQLAATDIPILSEEGAEIPYEERQDWPYYWLIDPLDGTKEFIKKNDEFTVNIALIHQGKAILGVVYAPVLDWMYYGNQDDGAFKVEEGARPIRLNIDHQPVETIVASRSHLSEETQAFIDQHPNADVISMGSSLKFMLVAENKAQLYPRFAPTMEWDTAASQAVVEAAGGAVLTYPENKPLQYNREDMLNGWFVVQSAD